MTEADIRDAIVRKLSACAAGRDAAFIPELHIDGFARRADLVVANGKLAAFEIKTSRDSLARLPGQLQSYRRFFEQVTVVCAEKHLPGVMTMADESVGVWVVTAAGRLDSLRKATLRPLTDKADWFSLVPVHELRALAKTQKLTAIGTRAELLIEASELPLATIRRFVLDCLKRREARVTALRTKRPWSSNPVNPVQARDDEVRRYLERMRQGAPLSDAPSAKA